MLHTKTLHYPSGIALQRSPPLFSSPGPDPYRSHDNVYEELEHRNSVNAGNALAIRNNHLLNNCDREIHSDEEEFAEDECSLPGDRSINKSSSDNTTVATIYQEHSEPGGSSSNSGNVALYRDRNRTERNSLLSSASSSALDSTNRPHVRNSSSSSESNNLYHHTLSNQDNGNSGGTNLFRFRTSRTSNRNKANTKTKTDNLNLYDVNNSSLNGMRSNEESSSSGNNNKNNSNNKIKAIGPSLVASNSDSMSSNNPFNGNHNHIDIGDTNNNNNSGSRSNSCNADDAIEDEVERLNRRNAQLSNPVLNVATIFRDRNNHYHNNPIRANANYYVPPQHIMSKRTQNASERARTNPRIDRRHNNNINYSTRARENAANNNIQEYLYHEPVYHENAVYDPYMTTSPSSSFDNDSQNQIYHHPYMMPEFTTFRNYNNLNNPHQPLYNASAAAAMGSDSGYSQNTQNSGRSLWSRRKRNGNNNNNFMPSASTVRDTRDGLEDS